MFQMLTASLNQAMRSTGWNSPFVSQWLAVIGYRTDLLFLDRGRLCFWNFNSVIHVVDSFHISFTHVVVDVVSLSHI